jgi:hypothetical protein
MPHYSYERLSAQDNMFLLMERPEVHMHVAATLIYEAGPLRPRRAESMSAASSAPPKRCST